MAAQILVMITTWMKTYSALCNLKRLRGGTGLTGPILRDGFLCFFNVFMFNVMTLIGDMAYGLTTNLADLAALEAILLSRFMLDLRTAASKPISGISIQTSITLNVVEEMGAHFDDAYFGSME
ncbi:uncharacterized protein FIBRA_07721 [Fibroporia radiculosa]|uniref:Uncharacterized protein n=1 Tax=Fibroporia radiculosa TaxID=599839 RepID=J4GFD4_9APHY|nr:uncharacterized protein FIBRA_07721 [Fibroporia radiculosa]CCM05498.1 predicted protein [Fibroporia radiculosa]